MDRPAIRRRVMRCLTMGRPAVGCFLASGCFQVSGGVDR
jgi:hypothetical protein